MLKPTKIHCFVIMINETMNILEHSSWYMCKSSSRVYTKDMAGSYGNASATSLDTTELSKVIVPVMYVHQEDVNSCAHNLINSFWSTLIFCWCIRVFHCDSTSSFFKLRCNLHTVKFVPQCTVHIFHLLCFGLNSGFL